MGRSIKFAAVALVWMVLSAGQAGAGTALYDFDNTGTLNGNPPLSGTTTAPNGFVYVTPITGNNDTGSPTLSALFQSFPTNVVIVPNPGGNANFAGNVLEVPNSTTLAIVFSAPVSSVSFDWALTTGLSAIAGNHVAVSEGPVNGSPFNTDTLGLSGTTAPSSGTYSFVATSPAQWFSQITIASNSASGTFYLDNMSVTPVPEIDPGSAVGALTLLGSAVVMIRSRRKSVRA